MSRISLIIQLFNKFLSLLSSELGEIAESTDECEYEFDESSKTCVCQKNYFYERDLRNCRKRKRISKVTP